MNRNLKLCDGPLVALLHEQFVQGNEGKKIACLLFLDGFAFVCYSLLVPHLKEKSLECSGGQSSICQKDPTLLPLKNLL